MELIASVILFLVLTGSIVLFGWRRYSKPAQLYEQLGMPVVSTITKDAPQPKSAHAADLLRMVGRIMPSNPQTLSITRDELVQAGYRGENASVIFSGIRFVSCLVLFITMFALREIVTSNPVLRIVMIAFSAGAGYSAPAFILRKLVSARHKKLRLALPDALDLMVIAVEAGLGMDQAISYVGKEIDNTHKELAEELRLMGFEMRAGKRRGDALKNMATRTGEAEIRKLVSVLTQTDRFGTSMATALRTHSEHMRIERRQQAEEKAAKIGVKLVFPIFFFIMPAMLVVSVGPGMLGLFKHLFPMMQEVAK